MIFDKTLTSITYLLFLSKRSVTEIFMRAKTRRDWFSFVTYKTRYIAHNIDDDLNVLFTILMKEKDIYMDETNKHTVNSVDLFKDKFLEKCHVCIYVLCNE